MKTIIAATDFSDASANAIAYAGQLANVLKAKLILFHVYHIPVISSEAPIVIPPLEEIEKSCLADLENSAKKIRSEISGKIDIECLCKCGFVNEELAEAVAGTKADLVVMGMQGAGYVGEAIIGSITTQFMKNAICPVLSIGEQVKFAPLKTIVLACDFKEKSDNKLFTPLKELALAFGSRLYVLNVVASAAVTIQAEDETEEDRVDFSLGAIDHSFHRIQNQDLVEGIEHFATDKKANLLVMIPHRLSFFPGLFHKRTTKEMAFHTHMPLLTLPEPSAH